MKSKCDKPIIRDPEKIRSMIFETSLFKDCHLDKYEDEIDRFSHFACMNLNMDLSETVRLLCEISNRYGSEQQNLYDIYMCAACGYHEIRLNNDAALKDKFYSYGDTHEDRNNVIQEFFINPYYWEEDCRPLPENCFEDVLDELAKDTVDIDAKIALCSYWWSWIEVLIPLRMKKDKLYKICSCGDLAEEIKKRLCSFEEIPNLKNLPILDDFCKLAAGFNTNRLYEGICGLLDLMIGSDDKYVEYVCDQALGYLYSEFLKSDHPFVASLNSWPGSCRFNYEKFNAEYSLDKYVPELSVYIADVQEYINKLMTLIGNLNLNLFESQSLCYGYWLYINDRIENFYY